MFDGEQNCQKKSEKFRLYAHIPLPTVSGVYREVAKKSVRQTSAAMRPETSRHLLTDSNWLDHFDVSARMNSNWMLAHVVGRCSEFGIIFTHCKMLVDLPYFIHLFLKFDWF